MMVAVLPFAADDVDPDAQDLARYAATQTVLELAAASIDAQLVAGAVPLEGDALAAVARQLGARLALGAAVRIEGTTVHAKALVAGEEGPSPWAHSVPIGEAAELGAMLARRVLRALGWRITETPISIGADGAAVLRLFRVARQIEDGDPDAPRELLSFLDEPALVGRARDLLLRSAAAGVGGERMPSLWSALESLAKAMPDDADVWLAVGEYRAVHLDESGARDALVRSRDLALDGSSAAEASMRLASLADRAGRRDEAIAHLRAAVRLSDDAAAYRRLGELLLDRDPAEALRMSKRAQVLVASRDTLRKLP